MSYGEQQVEEIKTIRERNITVKLSDADCNRLARKCGEHGLTVGELIENFIGDLVDGTHSNGSDEKNCAERWFNRCWFGMFSEQTLLNHLLHWGYEPEDYLDVLGNIESANENIKETEKEITQPSDKWKLLFHDKACTKACYSNVNEYVTELKVDLISYRAELEVWSDELKDMREDWKPEKEPNMDEELEIIKKWVKEKKQLLCK